MSELLVEFENATLYGDHRPRLDDVSIAIPSGAIAIVGYSGAGKTSLLNLITQFERPDRGTVTWNLPQHDDRLPMYWVPQTEGLWPHLTVAEHLRVVMPPKTDSKIHLESLLQNFGLDKRIATSSGTQQASAIRNQSKTGRELFFGSRRP